ncbi:hypothetical protein F4556_003633 [Kitasatospora gansuensis]|uniref:Uncharacterized protein n=2 Tax=Kitasatospora TaxID=2063 RepID=A0A7W7SDU7_9ACTN|nr:hypothetical protein [Kitasatospora gansuensis]
MSLSRANYEVNGVFRTPSGAGHCVIEYHPVWLFFEMEPLFGEFPDAMIPTQSG